MVDLEKYESNSLFACLCSMWSHAFYSSDELSSELVSVRWALGAELVLSYQNQFQLRIG